MNPILIDLLAASLPLGLGLLGTWRLVWPRWKLPGKVVAYFVGVGLLSAWIGHWGLTNLEGCGNAMKVYYAWFWEDSDRESAEGLGLVRVED